MVLLVHSGCRRRLAVVDPPLPGRRKWERGLNYRLVKALWVFTESRISVRFSYEWRDGVGNWFCR